MTERKPDRRAGCSPISVRVSAEERAQLVRAAAGLSLSVYVREQLFGRDPKADAATCLQHLGRLEIGKSLGRIAEACVSDSVQLDDHTRTEFKNALRDFQALRRDLLKSLGLRLKEDA